MVDSVLGRRPAGQIYKDNEEALQQDVLPRAQGALGRTSQPTLTPTPAAPQAAAPQAPQTQQAQSVSSLLDSLVAPPQQQEPQTGEQTASQGASVSSLLDDLVGVTPMAAPQPEPKEPGLALGDAFGKGLKGAKVTWDFLANKLEKAVTGDEKSTAPILAKSVEEYKQLESDPRIAEWVKKGDDAPGTFSAVRDMLGFAVRNPTMVANFLAEQTPAMVIGGGAGAVATAPLRGAAVNLATRAGASTVVSSAVGTGVTGAGLNVGAVTLGALGTNYVEGLSKYEGDTEAAAEYAVTKTTAEIPPNAIAGAFLGFMPFASRTANVLTQANIQGVGGATGAYMAARAVGEDPSRGELILEYLGEGLFAPAEIVMSRIGNKDQPTPEDANRINRLLEEAKGDLAQESGRQELYEAMRKDDQIRAVLEANNITSGEDPRFQPTVIGFQRLQGQLAELAPPTPEQQAETRQQRQADVQAAFGDTASTSVGVGTGATEPVIRRDSVTVDNEGRQLVPVGEQAQNVTLPDSAGTRAGTVAMSGEDIVSAQQGFQPMPAFQVGEQTVGNRFVTQAQAETFLFGPVNKATGRREGGYASSVDDMEFQIRRGQRSKEAGGGAFFFVEGRPRAEALPTPEPVAAPAAPAPVTEAPAPVVEAPAPAVVETEPTPVEAAAPAPAPQRTPAEAWNALGGLTFDALPEDTKAEWNEAVSENYADDVLANLHQNLLTRLRAPAPAPAATTPPKTEKKTVEQKVKEKVKAKKEQPKTEKAEQKTPPPGREIVDTSKDKKLGVDSRGRDVFEGTQGSLKGVRYTFDERGRINTGALLEESGTTESAKKQEPKKTVEQQVKEKQKAKKTEAKKEPTPAEKQKAEQRATSVKEMKKADADIGKSKVPKAVALEFWEDNDDGSVPHINFASLPKTIQQNWFDAVEDGYATAVLHDELVALAMQNQRADRIQSKVTAALETESTDPDAAFRISGDVKGMQGADVDAFVKAITQKWKNIPGINVVQSESDLPAPLQVSILKAEASGRVPGIFWRGQVYLVADNLTDANDVRMTVMHEVAGHFGLRTILGDSYGKVMDEVYVGNAAVRKLADQMVEREGLSRRLATEEVLADLAQMEAKPSRAFAKALREVFAAVRKWARETLGIKYMSDNDVKQIVANARAYVIEGSNIKDFESAMNMAAAMRQEGAPTFYSAMERAFRANKTERMPADQWKTWLASKAKDLGVKKEEIEWTGINDWFELNGKERLTKEEVLNWIAGNRVYVNEVVLSSDRQREALQDAVLAEYTEPDVDTLREDVRELHEEMEASGRLDPDDFDYVTPDDMTPAQMREFINEEVGWTRYLQQYRRKMENFQRGRISKMTKPKHGEGNLVLPGGTDYSEIVLFDPAIDAYKADDDIHFGDVAKGKALGWIRFNTRTDTNGNKVLFLEELQSQRGQDGRKKGFLGDADLPSGWEVAQNERGEWYVLNKSKTQVTPYEETKEAAITSALVGGVPDAPFVRETSSWTSLLLKRAIAHAQSKGIDRVAWTRGEQQNERYSFPGDQIAYVKNKGSDDFELTVMRGGRDIRTVTVKDKDLEAYVGAETADSIRNKNGALIDNDIETSGIIEGDDLRLAKTDLSPYYDKTVTSVAKDILKKFGGTTEIMNIEGTGQQIGFVIPDKLKQTVAEDGLPMFRIKDFEGQFDDLPANVRDMVLGKLAPKPPTIRERVEAITPMLRNRLVQGIFDKFRRIRDVNERAWKMARVSSGPQDGAVATMLYYGQVFNNDGALDYRQGTKGLREIMTPLGAEVDRFLMWVAANRAENLAKEERERFFKPDEITALKKLNQGLTKDGEARAAIYAKVLQEMNELNKSALEVARSAGVLDDAALKKFSSDIWYVPFYRDMQEEGTVAGPSMAKGLTGQEFSKKLKGADRPLNDLMENVLMNWEHILSAAMKNQAAVETLKAATQMNIAERVEPIDAERGRLANGDIVRLKGSVQVMENGKPARYFITDELLMDSLLATTTFQSSNLFLNIARPFKTTFTRMIALSPTYKVNMLIRDSIQSIGLSELGYNPFKNAKQGLQQYYTDRQSALAGGGLFTLGNAFDGDRNSNFRRLVASGVDPDSVLTTPQKTKQFLKRVWDKYDEASDAMENANRLTLHRKLRESGASQLDAVFAARDIQDFTSMGSWEAVRYLSAVVPYLNARLQGLYKMGRDGIDPVIQVLSGKADESQRQKAAKFSVVLGAVTIAGLVLYLSQMDDEDWKKREDWDRDNFFWYKVPGTETIVRIPKPFEIGAIASVVERLTEQMVDDSVEGKLFFKRLGALLADNLAMNPLPSEWQIFKPLYEIATNKDGFTGRDIESMGMERLSKINRTNQATSAAGVALGNINKMFAEGVSTLTGGAVDVEDISLSPIQYDYMLRGYLGWLGTVIQTSSNIATAPFKPGESSRYERIDDFLFVGNFVKTAGAQPNTRYVTEFYESARAASLAASDMQHFVNLGQIDKAKQVMLKDGDLVALNRLYTKASKMMSTIGKQIKAIQDDPNMSGAAKRAEIERLNRMRAEYAKQVEELRKQARK